jgi:hypothetical protein
MCLALFGRGTTNSKVGTQACVQHGLTARGPPPQKQGTVLLLFSKKFAASRASGIYDVAGVKPRPYVQSEKGFRVSLSSALSRVCLSRVPFLTGAIITIMRHH